MPDQLTCDAKINDLPDMQNYAIHCMGTIHFTVVNGNFVSNIVIHCKGPNSTFI